MDIFGVICFFWAVTFVFACVNFKFMTWNDLNPFMDIDQAFQRNPRGLAFAPFIFALLWPSARGKISPEGIPMIFWERLFLTALGVVFILVIQKLLFTTRED